MNDAKYIGLDVHQATISVAVLDSARKHKVRRVVCMGTHRDLFVLPRTRLWRNK